MGLSPKSRNELFVSPQFWSVWVGRRGFRLPCLELIDMAEKRHYVRALRDIFLVTRAGAGQSIEGGHSLVSPFKMFITSLQGTFDGVFLTPDHLNSSSYRASTSSHDRFARTAIYNAHRGDLRFHPFPITLIFHPRNEAGAGFPWS